jgi:mannitol-1-/sugar-/sorbitol-6-phosphatase
MTFVLSDLDGVLVDSGDAVERVWREWALERGVDPELVVRTSHGVPARGVLERVAPHLLTDAEVERIDRLHAATGGRALPGARELLARDRVGVVTSCGPPLAAARLRAAVLPAPRVLITSDMTARGKPHPDPYLAGAAALGADPADCVVIEDAPAGIAAARAAGMRVWAVTTTHAPADLDDADAIAPSVADLIKRCGLLALASSCEKPYAAYSHSQARASALDS